MPTTNIYHHNLRLWSVSGLVNAGVTGEQHHDLFTAGDTVLDLVQNGENTETNLML